MNTERRPTTAEIEAALQQVTAVSGYDYKIKAHLIAILDRAQHDAAKVRDAERNLFALLPSSIDSAEKLAAAISCGDFSVDQRVLRALRELTLARVAIDNPTYSTYRKYRRSELDD